MSLCQNNKNLTKEIRDFLMNVQDVNEESITDYMVWKWREIDKRFKAIKVSTFTRHEESTISGADFELEIWLVGKKYSYPLVFQAKKFIKPFNSYVSKLKYPANSKSQMNTLLKYAATNNKIPFYTFYSLPDKNTKVRCQQDDVMKCGVFISHALDVEKIANGKCGTRVSMNKILETSIPLHCIFCCSFGEIGGKFTKYLKEQQAEYQEGNLPKYVDYLLNEQQLQMNSNNQFRILKLIEKYNLNIYRYVSVYDMRDIEELPYE